MAPEQIKDFDYQLVADPSKPAFRRPKGAAALMSVMGGGGVPRKPGQPVKKGRPTRKRPK